MSSNPKISVIVPVYKVEPYLDHCVQSICAQTFSDFELILVDDGSPDRCPAICDAWAEKDARIRVIHQKNAGLSGARNSGIEAAQGLYLSFVDSDDYIEPDMLQNLVAALEKSDAQMAVCNLVYEDENGILFRYPDFSSLQDQVIDPDTYWKGYFSAQGVYYTVAWNKLYRKELFNTVRYPLGKRNEDEFILGDLLAQCTRIACLGKVGYHYIQRGGSIMQNNQEYLDCWEVHLLRARERCLAGETLLAEGILNNVILNLWKKQDNWKKEQELRRRFRRAVAEASRIYGMLARKTGQKGMWLRALLLRTGLESYVRFLKKRNPELFEELPLDPQALAAYEAAMKAAAKCPRRFVLMQTPTHGNLGDHAIAVAERRFLKEHFPDVPLIEVPGFAFSSAPKAYRALMDPERDTILITGGGFAGSLWEQEEHNILSILRELAGFSVVMLPQTLYYADEQAGETRQALEVYNTCPRLLFLAREEETLDRMRRLLPRTSCELIPDMVLSLAWNNQKKKRSGIGLCLRRDKEGLLDESARAALAKNVKNTFPGQAVVWTDTVQPGELAPADGEQAVWNKLEEFAGYRLIVTDRLHGMVFAALTATPCIVLDNCDHKVRSVYKWVQQNPYMVYLENVQDLPRALETVQPMLNSLQHFDAGTTRILFDTLAQRLR